MEIAVFATSSVMPSYSYGLVRMKCGSSESSITYSSSMTTYRVFLSVLSDNQDAISRPLQCPMAESMSSRLTVSNQLSPTFEGVMSMTCPGIFLTCHISWMASSPRYFHDDSITMSACVASIISFRCFTALGSKKRHAYPATVCLDTSADLDSAPYSGHHQNQGIWFCRS